MMVDISRLEQKMKDCGVSKESFAKGIGVDVSTVYRKLANNGESFTIGEMHKVVKLLNLTNAEACLIFLSDNSHKCENAS